MAQKSSQRAATSMLRPKAVRKSARPLVSKSIDFPVDKLPPELIHMICAYLKPTEVASLRRVSRLAALIGLQYMVPEVHVILAKDSFENLKALAEHPIASKYVTSFFFEADKLGVLSRKYWEPLVAGPQYVAQVQELRMRGHPCRYATERSLRTFKRDVNKLTTEPRHHYTKAQMDHAFEKYLDFTHFQQDPNEVAVQEKEVAEAMKHFPALKELTIATQCCTRAVTSRLKKTFEQAFCTYYQADDPQESEPLGLPQLRAVLLGAYHAGSKVESLHCGVVSWRILTEESENFARMMASVAHVKSLRLDFATGYAYYEDLWEEQEIDSCSTYLETGRLKDFVTAAPNLEHLEVGFQSNKPAWASRLEQIVGKHHWPSLKTVHLKRIRSSEDDFVSFCSRHASTLKSLHLTSIGLDEGDWFSAFNRMRKFLTLDTMSVSGQLEGTGELLDFEIGSEEYCPELQDGIQAFFLDPCTGDEMNLADFLDFFLPSSDDRWSEFDSDEEDDGWW